MSKSVETGWVETYRGAVYPWHCDHMGHMNVMWYVGKFDEATWMAGEAIQALGGMGYISETPTGRLWRDAKLYEIGAGTSEIRRWLIGRELFAETR